ncbi:MAG: MerR family transcriptional regulator [Ardenticatenaceae bacterium]|nr:MerR family transcriptional regulator [Ardenticatenaceae bacterium]
MTNSTNTISRFSIQETAELTGLSVHTLRYYEKIGLVPHIARDANKRRLYDEQDIGWLRFLRRMRISGMSIQTMKRFVQLTRSGDDSIQARCELLQEHRANLISHMEELKTCLTVLEDKIAFYEASFPLIRDQQDGKVKEK